VGQKPILKLPNAVFGPAGKFVHAWARIRSSRGFDRDSTSFPLYPNEAEGGSPYGGVGLISLIHETREIGDGGGGGSASLCGEEVAWRLRAPAATA
jgi:hypothetical protein